MEFKVVQAIQLGAFPLFFAPFLKRSPISPQEAEDAPLRSGVAFQPDYAVSRGHLRNSREQCFDLDQNAMRERGRLTSGLHFPHRRLILCVATVARAPAIGGPPRELPACAISSRTTHSTPTGASCIAGRTLSPSRHRYS